MLLCCRNGITHSHTTTQAWSTCSYHLTTITIITTTTTSHRRRTGRRRTGTSRHSTPTTP